MEQKWKKIDKNKVQETNSGVIVDVRELKKELQHFKSERDLREDPQELDDEIIKRAVKIHTDREERKMFVTAIKDKKEEIDKFEKMLGA